MTVAVTPSIVVETSAAKSVREVPAATLYVVPPMRPLASRKDIVADVVLKFVGRTKVQYKSINKLQETEGSQIDLLPRTNLAHFSKGKLEEDMNPKKMPNSFF